VSVLHRFPIALDTLITYVQAGHPDGGLLDRLTDAVIVAEQLNEHSDALIGHFVDQARSSGATWNEIGRAMGVSKQAAQKRFVIRASDLSPEGKTFSRFAPRARSALAAAGQVAGLERQEAVDTRHLVAGLLAEPDGLAARALHRLGANDEEVYQAIGVGPAPGGYDPDPSALRLLTFTSDCRQVLQDALTAALHYGHNYIGTEHLLVGVGRAAGDVGQRLADLGLSAGLVERAVEVELAQAQLERERRIG
jgi:ATP-dependent Clp protease ATP-binding subunit ClpA